MARSPSHPSPPCITDVMFIIVLLTNIQRVLALSNRLKTGLCQLVYAQIAEDKALKSAKLCLSNKISLLALIQ